MEFSRQEYWNWLPSCTPRDLPDPGIKPESLASPAMVGRFFFLPLSHLGNPNVFLKLFSYSCPDLLISHLLPELLLQSILCRTPIGTFPEH